MSQVPVWFERKFDFRFPAEQYRTFASVCVVRETSGQPRSTLGICWTSNHCGKSEYMTL